MGLIFPAIGLLLALLGDLLPTAMAQVRQSEFQMADVPGVIGGQLAGVIRTSAKILPEDGFHLYLRCVRRVTTGSGKQRHTSESVRWENEQTVMHELLEDQAELSAIPVVFPIPGDCWPSDSLNADDQTIWRLVRPWFAYRASTMRRRLKCLCSQPPSELILLCETSPIQCGFLWHL